MRSGKRLKPGECRQHGEREHILVRMCFKITKYKYVSSHFMKRVIKSGTFRNGTEDTSKLIETRN